LSRREEEDACHMRRRIHVVLDHVCLSLLLSRREEEDACHMRRRIHVVLDHVCLSLLLSGGRRRSPRYSRYDDVCDRAPRQCLPWSRRRRRERGGGCMYYNPYHYYVHACFSVCI
jgi:hypothetical protein